MKVMMMKEGDDLDTSITIKEKKLARLDKSCLV